MLHFKLPKRQRPTAILGLALDGNRLDGAVVRRTNGSLEVQPVFSVSLSLDPLTHDLELVGRELRNHLEAAGVRERRCVLAVPLKWVLTATTELPELPEADLASCLQVEAERSFPCDPETLQVVSSRWQDPAGRKHATIIGVPRNHLIRLDQVLRAAQLRPLSFSLGLPALQPASPQFSEGVLALAIGQSHVALQVTVGGGVVALRALEGAVEGQSGQPTLQVDLVAREVRITLGQLRSELRQDVRRLRVFGPPELARELAEELEARIELSGLRLETVTAYAPNEFGLQLPPPVAVSPAISLAAAWLAHRPAVFELLPPRTTPWQQFMARYSGGRLRRIGIAAAAVFLLVAGLFGVQQWQLSRARSQWAVLGPKVRDLDAIQQDIRRFRPWFDESFRSLTILRQLTEAFPEEGSVSAKTIEIRHLTAVTCSGVARANTNLLRTLERLRAVPRVAGLKVDVIRGKSPMQFTFSFQWNEGGTHAD
jgi:hypothetical protein